MCTHLALSQSCQGQNQLDVESAFRPCGHDLAELFNSMGWAFYVKWRDVPSPDAGRPLGINLAHAGFWTTSAGLLFVCPRFDKAETRA